MITGFIKVFGVFLISDFIPYLRFVTKLQGWDKWMLEAKKVAFGICTNMMQLEERRNLREARGDKFKDRDFLDMLMSDKDALSDEVLKQVVVVNASHNHFFIYQTASSQDLMLSHWLLCVFHGLILNFCADPTFKQGFNQLTFPPFRHYNCKIS